jgi:tetratricopeptide (TPR) repeat protein
MICRKFFLFGLFLFHHLVFAQSKAYVKEEADDYFKAGRYWDAFFKYREAARFAEFQGNQEVDQQIKNSSRAMYLWKKTEDHRAFRQYDLAKKNLSDLIILNPYDPNKGLLPRLTLEQANEYQRAAYGQRNIDATNQYIKKALDLYNLALEEGLKDEMVFSLMKQCEAALQKNKANISELPTTYGINYQKQKEAELKRREVRVIKEEKPQ